MSKEAAPVKMEADFQGTDLASLLTLSYEPMLAWRLDGPIAFWNSGAERLYGFSAGEAIGRVSHSLLQTKFPIEFTELRSQLQNECHWSGELRHTCKDGREVIVDSRMQLFAGDVVLEVNRDVTELKALSSRQAKLTRDLSDTAIKFEALFNQSGIFAGIMDLQGNLREVNALAVDWCGYTREQVLDRPFWNTPWWRGSDEMKTRIRFATDQASLGHVFREELKAASASWILRCIICDQWGAVMFLYPTGIDITERKLLENARDQTAEALRESEHRLRVLASIVESSDDAIVSKSWPFACR